MFNNFKWYRKWYGGYWVQYDMRGYMSRTTYAWLQSDEITFDDMQDMRIVAREYWG